MEVTNRPSTVTDFIMKRTSEDSDNYEAQRLFTKAGSQKTILDNVVTRLMQDDRRFPVLKPTPYTFAYPNGIMHDPSNTMYYFDPEECCKAQNDEDEIEYMQYHKYIEQIPKHIFPVRYYDDTPPYEHTPSLMHAVTTDDELATNFQDDFQDEEAADENTFNETQRSTNFLDALLDRIPLFMSVFEYQGIPRKAIKQLMALMYNSAGPADDPFSDAYCSKVAVQIVGPQGTGKSTILNMVDYMCTPSKKATLDTSPENLGVGNLEGLIDNNR